MCVIPTQPFGRHNRVSNSNKSSKTTVYQTFFRVWRYKKNLVTHSYFMCVFFTPVRIVDVERVLHALLGGVDGVGSAGLGQRGRLPRRVLCHQALLKASQFPCYISFHFGQCVKENYSILKTCFNVRLRDLSLLCPRL